MQSTKIILFNGPPRSGKDTASIIALRALGNNAIGYRFAEPIKDAVHALFGMRGLLAEHYDPVKDEPSDDFLGMTPRDAYIWLSEQAVKPQFGPEFFTKVAIRKIRRMAKPLQVVVSDCGFQPEVDGMLNEFGEENVLVIKLVRPGCDFSKDSRGYVMAPNYSIVENDSTTGALRDTVTTLVRSFVYGR